MGETMNRSAFPIRVVGLVGMVVLLALIVTRPVGAFPFLYQNTPEPTPRPTVTPAPYLELNPTQSVAGDPTTVTASGALWTPGVDVILRWDGTSPALASVTVDSEGRFQTTFEVPTDIDGRGSVGMHTVTAVQGGLQAEATYQLVAPTPTPTPTATNTPRPTNTPEPTPTNTPITPSPTSPPTDTATPGPTLRPVTPIVTITPLVPTKGPVATRRPTATRTNTPVPGTPTDTPTPSVTPSPSATPGPGTPSATPQPTPTAAEEISDTGLGWGTIFLWGIVLAGLLVVFRLLRVRGLPG